MNSVTRTGGKLVENVSISRQAISTILTLDFPCPVCNQMTHLEIDFFRLPEYPVQFLNSEPTVTCEKCHQAILLAAKGDIRNCKFYVYPLDD